MISQQSTMTRDRYEIDTITSYSEKLDSYKEDIYSYFGNDSNNSDSNSGGDDHSLFLQLKGQMIYFTNWKSIAFLGAPKYVADDNNNNIQ